MLQEGRNGFLIDPAERPGEIMIEKSPLDLGV
jgi:hypothetical protein